VVRPHELQKLDTWKYLKLDFGEKEKAYFNEEFYVDKKTGRLVRKFVFVEPWRFVLCVRPNIIDKVRIRDVELESRIKQVDNYMERNDFRKRQQRIMHGNYQNWRYFDFEKFSEKNALKNQPLQRILDDLKDEC
jgi:hypothetical protein